MRLKTMPAPIVSRRSTEKTKLTLQSCQHIWCKWRFALGCGVQGSAGRRCVACFNLWYRISNLCIPITVHIKTLKDSLSMVEPAFTHLRGAGKTSILQRFLGADFSGIMPTIGVDVETTLATNFWKNIFCPPSLSPLCRLKYTIL